MRLYELNRDGGLLADIIRRQRSQEAARTGLHISTICDDFLKALDPSRYAKEINTVSVFGFQEVGNVLEDVLAARLLQRIPGWRKPDPRRDERGIIGSPDGENPASGTIDEVKATWISEGVPERNPFVRFDTHGTILEESLKFTRYRMQAMHYAYIWGYRRIRFHILFINGNYRPPFPNFRTLTLVVTEQDLAHNAFLLWQHAEDRGWLKQINGKWRTFPPQKAA